MQELGLSDRELDELFTTSAHQAIHPTNSYNMRIDLEPIHSSHMTGASSPASSAPSSPVYSPKSEMIPLPEGVVPQRCGYRTGKCQNLQAVKRNGKLHKLCEFHREKANQNQKKLDRKKRMLRYSPYDNHHASSDDEDSVKSLESSPRSIDEYEVFAPHPTSLHEAPLALVGEELAIFYSLMTFDINQLTAAPSMARPAHMPAYQPYATTV